MTAQRCLSLCTTQPRLALCALVCTNCCCVRGVVRPLACNLAGCLCLSLGPQITWRAAEGRKADLHFINLLANGTFARFIGLYATSDPTIVTLNDTVSYVLTYAAPNVQCVHACRTHGCGPDVYVERHVRERVRPGALCL